MSFSSYMFLQTFWTLSDKLRPKVNMCGWRDGQLKDLTNFIRQVTCKPTMEPLWTVFYIHLLKWPAILKAIRPQMVKIVPFQKLSCQLVTSKTHKRLKEQFLIGRNRTKRAHFRGSPLFQATYKTKTEKYTINSTYFVSVRCGRMVELKGHETLLVNQLMLSAQTATKDHIGDGNKCQATYYLFRTKVLKPQNSSKSTILASTQT